MKKIIPLFFLVVVFGLTSCNSGGNDRMQDRTSDRGNIMQDNNGDNTHGDLEYRENDCPRCKPKPKPPCPAKPSCPSKPKCPPREAPTCPKEQPKRTCPAKEGCDASEDYSGNTVERDSILEDLIQ